MRALPLALGLLLPSLAAGAVDQEPVAAVLASLRADYLQDRQPSWFLRPPAGLSADDVGPLQKVTEAVNSVQAGCTRPSNASRGACFEEQRLARKVLNLDARDPAVVAADRRYDARELPQPAHFALNIERAREARRELLNGAAVDMAKHWDQFRARMFGPLIDPLVDDPEARLVLPPGHPYRGLLDPNSPPEDEEGRDVKRWVEEESRRRGTDKLPFAERLRALAEIHAQAAERVDGRVRVHCAAPNSYACARARQRRQLHRSNASLFPELAQCADKPQECGGELCGVLLVCEAGRSIVAAALTPALALQVAGDLAMGKLRFVDRVARKGSDAVASLVRPRRGSVPSAGAQPKAPPASKPGEKRDLGKCTEAELDVYKAEVFKKCKGGIAKACVRPQGAAMSKALCAEWHTLMMVHEDCHRIRRSVNKKCFSNYYKPAGLDTKLGPQHTRMKHIAAEAMAETNSVKCGQMIKQHCMGL